MILAFDISLVATGFARAESGKIVDSGILGTAGCDGVKRLIQVRNRIMDKVDTAKPELVIMEDLAFSRNEAYAKEVAGASWMVRAELYTDGIPYVLVGASSLKKFVCGHGGSAKNPVKKEHVLKAVYQRWNHDVNSNDQADAIVLAYIGMALLAEWQPTTEAQMAVLETVRKAHKGMKFSPLHVGAPAAVGVEDGW